MRSLADRLLAKTLITSTCWLWHGSTREGYGLISVKNKTESTHRVAYVLWIGPIPTGLDVLHKCDTPNCVNPEHLFVGTKLDNAKDRDDKGRQVTPVGEKHGRAKLTNDDVRYIRFSPEDGQTLAVRFNVSVSTISLIRLRKRWVHI